MAINGLLLAVTAATIGLVQLRDRSGPQIEATIHRYAAAVASSDLDSAVGELAPEERARWAPWVESQLGNRYEVRAVSVRSLSLLDQLTRHASGRPFEATVAADVNRDDPAEFYQASARTAVTEDNGRWYLVAPLLAPTEASSSVGGFLVAAPELDP